MPIIVYVVSSYSLVLIKYYNKTKCDSDLAAIEVL